MTKPEFARSHNIDKAPRVLAYRKIGMNDNYFEVLKNNVMFHYHTAFRYR
jgi:hypothetical protein